MEGDTERRLAEELAAALLRRRADIQQRWLSRVRADVETTGVTHSDLLDALPDYLVLLAEALRSEGTLELGGLGAWRQVAREHALTRVRLGFDVQQLVHEFILLRRVLFEVAEEEGLIDRRHQGERMADLVEAAIAESVRTYVAARDYGARRREAEHIGFLTHELRSPLNTALLAAAQIRRKSATSVELSRPLDMLERTLRRLERLVNDVLDAARLEAGEVRSQPVELRVAELVDPIVASAQLTAYAKGVVFDARVDPGLTATIDRGLTTTAIQNLVDNAIKFTDQGRVELVVEDQQEELAVHVRDGCGGIPAKTLRRLFEPFRRGDTEKPGTGLGLAISRRAIEAQGGILEVESIEGLGCHFWFVLPKTAVPPPESSAEEEEPEGG